MSQWEYCTLTNDGTGLFYTTYHDNGLYTDKRPFNQDFWGWCIYTLGLLGWEAISVTNATTSTIWHFKRTIDPTNDTFALP